MTAQAMRTTIRGLLAGVVALALSACAPDPAASSSLTYECTVTLTLNPASFGDLSSPSGSATGTGTADSEQAALSAAYRDACSQLPLSDSEARSCRNGDTFTVAGGGAGNVALHSTVSRRVQCSGGN